MKKRTAFLAVLTFVLAFVLVACGGGSSSGGSAPKGGAADTEKGEGVMTYAEYAAAAVDDAVTIEAYVQGKQSWWDNKATIYAQDADGGYFIYNATCSEEDYAKLVDGQKIKVTGYKAEWSGEIEVVEGVIEFEDGNYLAAAVDVTDKLGTDELINFQNQKVAFKGMTIEASKDASGADVAYIYNWDGSGTDGDDLYFNVTDGKATYQFTVESYLTGAGTDVYEAVKALNVGDTVDLEGFLYWYEGANPHITSVTVK
ncbi:MAG: hypothetical protein Q4D48_06960 [Coriobacteriales bacterium]|jgi:hypothetical protein|nr:hypothetical protein [Coriobacteriales bacterium]